GLFAKAGFWQLDRAAQREALADEVAAAADAPTQTLHANSTAQSLQPWHKAKATGQWMHRYTILLENRNHQGTPGYWVATPLRLADDTAVMVLRGWLSRDDAVHTNEGGAPVLDNALGERLAPEDATATVKGE